MISYFYQDPTEEIGEEEAEEEEVCQRPDTPTLPPQVFAAINFVKLCNDNMGFRLWEAPDPERFGQYKTKVRMIDLHPAQEGALRLACQCLGDYFVGKKRGKRERTARG